MEKKPLKLSGKMVTIDINKEPEVGSEPTILPWYESAAHDIIKAVNPQIAAMRDNPDWEPGMYEQRFNDTTAIIARHDPHAATLRLLERSVGQIVLTDINGDLLTDNVNLVQEIRAHLAAHRQTGGGK